MDAKKPGLQHHMDLSAKNLTLVHANIEGADQPARPRTLISAFVIRYLKGITIKYLLLALESRPNS